jgi:uncharacterized protein VirK/YbjX
VKLFSAIQLLRDSHQHVSPFEAAKYFVRGLLSPRSHSAWNGYLLRDQQARARTQAQPQLVWKLQRDYLSRGVGTRCKLEWLRQHHDWVASHWPAEQVSRLYDTGGLVLAELPSSQAAVVYRLHLCMDAQFAKEGELVLSLWRCDSSNPAAGDRSRVAALAFAIHQHAGAWVAHIGCLQGADHVGAADLIRQATRELHGLRPKQAVVVALYALTQARKIDHVRAVANADHVYQSHWRRRNRVLADYDAYWAELGATPDGSAWRLPAKLGRKAQADIASKKRSQYRRRHALEDQMIGQIHAALRSPGGAEPAALALADAEALAAIFGPPHGGSGDASDD